MVSIAKERELEKNRHLIKSLIGPTRVIYTDVDGTLVGPKGSLFRAADGSLTLAAAKAIMLASERGVDIVMVSGRSARQLFGDARILGLNNYIAEMGCEIVYGGGSEMVKNFEDLAGGDISLYEAIAKSGSVELLFERYPGRLEYHAPWSEGRNCTHVFRGHVDISQAMSLLGSVGLKDLKLIDNGVIARRGTLDKSVKEVHAYHLMPKSASKQSGLARDMEIRKIPMKTAIAIGDAVSDVAMAEHVGAFFLVRNALMSKDRLGLEEEIAKHKNVFVTESEMGEGFAEVVELALGD